MPKVGYKFTTEQKERLSQSHLGQHAWNKGTGGCNRGHDPSFYKALPSGRFLCFACKHENCAEYRAKNREKIHLKGRVARYKMTAGDLADFWVRQKGLCAICSIPLDKVKYRIDHDHKTLQVRGLLCASCNTGIGLLKDSAEIVGKAMEYLSNGC